MVYVEVVCRSSAAGKGASTLHYRYCETTTNTECLFWADEAV
mgnify:CR=1 FL=1